MSLSKHVTNALVSRKARKPSILPRSKNWDSGISGEWKTDHDRDAMVDCYQYKVVFQGSFSCQPNHFEEAFKISKHSMLSSIYKEELEIIDRLREALYDHDIELSMSLCNDLQKEITG